MVGVANLGAIYLRAEADDQGNRNIPPIHFKLLGPHPNPAIPTRVTHTAPCLNPAIPKGPSLCPSG